jgi:hypothetical protein
MDRRTWGMAAASPAGEGSDPARLVGERMGHESTVGRDFPAPVIRTAVEVRIEFTLRDARHAGHVDQFARALGTVEGKDALNCGHGDGPILGQLGCKTIGL